MKSCRVIHRVVREVRKVGQDAALLSSIDLPERGSRTGSLRVGVSYLYHIKERIFQS